MADVVVRTHIPAKNGIPEDKLHTALTELIQAVHSNVDTVGFTKGTENEEGINAIQIRTVLNKQTKDQLEAALKHIFGQVFEISFNSDQTYVNAGPSIHQKAIELRQRLFQLRAHPR